LKAGRNTGRFERLSSEQKAGQRLMIGFDGTGLSQELKVYIHTFKAGGVILFARNIETPAQITELCRSIQDHAASCGQPPLFIGIDQEGGTVARLKAPFTMFPGNRAIGSLADAETFARITAAELTAIGVNMNMAPVLDVVPEGFDGVMRDRVFGSDPYRVAELGLAVIARLQRDRIMAVAKHFPGIGRTALDSHLDRPALAAELADLERFDLVPFKQAAANGVAGMMLSHILYDRIDADWPASLSVEIAHRLLRRQLGFEGLVLTDDLDMGAIVKYYDIDTVMGRIAAAGIDIALICHPGPKIERAFEALLKMVEDRQTKTAAARSVERILRLKRAYLSA